MLLTLGYVVSNAWEGYLKGRYHAVINRLRALQSAEMSPLGSPSCGFEATETALQAVSRVLVLQFERRRACEVLAEAAKESEEEIARLEGQRFARTVDLTDEARRHIQDAYDEMAGCMCHCERMMDWAIGECEPSPWFWRRLWIALFWYRPSRRPFFYRY